MQSELEMLVEYDMWCNGFDPSSWQDIIAYWKEHLG